MSSPPRDAQSHDSGGDDELRRLLAELDPMSGVPVEPVNSPQARHRLEQIMHNDTHNQSETADVVPLARRRRGRIILAAAASVAVIGVGTTVALNVNGGSSPDPAANLTTLALSAPGGDAAMQMCMVFDAEALRGVPTALSGTVVSLDDRTVTLDVDRWYKGGDADRVTIALPPGAISPALVPGVDFVEGQQFLISAYDNTVSGCGFSGPATPEMKKVFDEAFGG